MGQVTQKRLDLGLEVVTLDVGDFESEILVSRLARSSAGAWLALLRGREGGMEGGKQYQLVYFQSQAFGVDASSVDNDLDSLLVDDFKGHFETLESRRDPAWPVVRGGGRSSFAHIGLSYLGVRISCFVVQVKSSNLPAR